MAWNFSWADGSSGFLSGQSRRRSQLNAMLLGVGSQQRLRLHTWVMNHGLLAICLLDLEVGGRGGDAQGVIVGRVDDHGEQRQITVQPSEYERILIWTRKSSKGTSGEWVSRQREKHDYCESRIRDTKTLGKVGPPKWDLF